MIDGIKELNLNSTDITKLLDCIQDGIFLIDKNGKVVNMNRVSAKLTSIPKKEIINKNMYDLVRQGIFDEDETVSIKSLETGKPVHRIQKGIYGKYDILSTAIPYKENGQIKFVIVTERDITMINNLKTELEEQSIRAEKYKAELDYYRIQNMKSNDIIFKSDVMGKLVSTALHVAENDATVLIQGDSGTGKEVIANLIQKHSNRNKMPFVKINCSTIPENLIESELFGYEKGSFTGASNKGKIGFFELANKGTLFLDEIDTLPVHLQSKLLRVLQENEFYRVGGNEQIKVDVRIIAATNGNLQELMETGAFRKDLYYRLNVVPIYIPQLKDRVEDILPLAQHFLKKYNDKYSSKKVLNSSAKLLLTQYSWPGNVRELENFIERLVVSVDENTISGEIVSASLHNKSMDFFACTRDSQQGLKEMIEQFEKNIIEEYMKLSPNSIILSRQLKIDKATLNRKIKKYNITTDYAKQKCTT